MGGIQDALLDVAEAVLGKDEINKLLINKLVKRGRSRPHPWSTLNDYISWRGLNDRTYNARLLPAKPYPADEALGTRRPPLGDVAALFKAIPGKQRTCAKSTVLFPSFAQYLTDGFIRTRMSNDPKFEDRRRTTSNHEIDQSPLYGRTIEQTDALRLKSNKSGQKGRLKTQKIGNEEWSPYLYDAAGILKKEFAVLDLPLGVDSKTPVAVLSQLFAVGGDRVNANPQVAMMNTLWLREHNRLAAMLEGGNPKWDDDRVFETARNILIWMFIKIVVEEYINHINTADFRFLADPEVAWDADWNRPNWMTAEFSLLYRWHSLVPQTFDWMGKQVDGKSMSFNNKMLVDAGLANAFVAFSANRATCLGLGNSADFLERAEEKAINQARTNNIATLNDYREAMGMDRHESFEELVGKSKDPVEKARRVALAAELKRLYGGIDNVEFYVGLFAEPPERNGPLPDLLLAMVAMDAFSQALTNPLLSHHVMGDDDNRRLAFTDAGIAAVKNTNTLADILKRNSENLNGRFVGMTRQGWKRE